MLIGAVERMQGSNAGNIWMDSESNAKRKRSYWTANRYLSTRELL